MNGLNCADVQNGNIYKPKEGAAERYRKNKNSSFSTFPETPPTPSNSFLNKSKLLTSSPSVDTSPLRSPSVIKKFAKSTNTSPLVDRLNFTKQLKNIFNDSISSNDQLKNADVAQSKLISESILNFSIDPIKSQDLSKHDTTGSIWLNETKTKTFDFSSSSYKSYITPRNTVVSKRGLGTKKQLNFNSNKAISIRPTKTTPIIETRDKEKQQLKDLNEIFAGYVERVKYLEASNKKLELEMNYLKSRQGTGMKQIEIMYQIELDEAKNVLNDTRSVRTKAEGRLNKTEQEMESMKLKNCELENNSAQDKLKIKSLQEKILANEAEIGLLKRRLSDLRDEEARLKQETIRIMNECNRVSTELETEMKARLVLETDKQLLEEELVFLKEIHAKELQELKKEVLKDTGFDPTQYFKNELTNAIRQIRQEYENLNMEQRSEMDRWYTCKVTEIKRSLNKPLTNVEVYTHEQARKLKSQLQESKQSVIDMKAKNALLECRIRDLQEEIQREHDENQSLLAEKDGELDLLKENLTRIKCEYEDLISFKTDLESEIKTYRRLLEGEEQGDGLKQIVETIEQRHRSMSSFSPAPLTNSTETRTVRNKKKEFTLQIQTGRSTLL